MKTTKSTSRISSSGRPTTPTRPTGITKKSATNRVRPEPRAPPLLAPAPIASPPAEIYPDLTGPGDGSSSANYPPLPIFNPPTELDVHTQTSAAPSPPPESATPGRSVTTDPALENLRQSIFPPPVLGAFATSLRENSTSPTPDSDRDPTGRTTTPSAPAPVIECFLKYEFPSSTDSYARPLACPAGYCKARFAGKDRARSLRRHIKYVVDQGPGKNLHYNDHVEVYQRNKAEAATSPEKQKAAQKKYRESHRLARAESTRKSALRKKAKNLGIADPAKLEAQVQEWMKEREPVPRTGAAKSSGVAPSPGPSMPGPESDVSLHPHAGLAAPALGVSSQISVDSGSPQLPQDPQLTQMAEMHQAAHVEMAQMAQMELES